MQQINGVKIHPAANIFPMMTPAEKAGLLEDVREHGVRTPLVFRGLQLEDAELVDGRNRLEVIEDLGLRYQDYAECVTPDDMPDPVAYVLSLNLHRRHLTESQRGLVAGEIANLQHGHRSTELQICNSGPAAASLQSAADALSVSKRTAAAGRKVVTSGTDELKAEVATGKMAVSKAAKIAAKPKEEQAAAIAKAKEPKPRPKRASKQPAKGATKKGESHDAPAVPVAVSGPLKKLRDLHQTTSTQEDAAVNRFAEWVLEQSDIKTIHEGCAVWSTWR